MERIASLEEFRSLRESVTEEARDGKPCLVICAGTGGHASGSNDLIRIIKRHILERELRDRISLRITGCLGFCEMDPFIIVEPGYNLYPRLSVEDVPGIIDAALKGEVIEELLYREPGSDKKYCSQLDIPFFKGQKRAILGYNQRLDPIKIFDYIRIGGYSALEKALDKSDPDWLIREITKSGLRGRGGAGFPTGRKWEFARNAGNGSTEKFLVCNADEGDPGAYMDRGLLEGNPHIVLEGMIIAGMAVGATKGIIYVRSEYPLAIKHALIAINQARYLGILGKNILGAGFSFDVSIVRGAGAFVCGEETALIRSIEGRIGEPRQRPPYPIKKGIFGHPTCINNVETLANVPTIIARGADEYAKVGVPGSTGTKVFSLVGKIRHTGLVEVPMGTTIKEIVYDIGGGPAGKAKIKAVQTGGPSGGCIPAAMFDLPVDYDSLNKVGSIMGSGGMIVMDENTCMVDVAKYFMNFLKDESCGKCFTCRKGTQRMYEILDDISKGKGTLEQLDLLEELALVVKDTTMCGLGQTASNPVLSTLKYYREEYVQHIENRRCPAGVCKELVGAPCQSSCPLGTEAWRYIAHISRGEYEEAYQAIRQANPFPSVCARVCNHPCEDRCKVGTTGGESIAIRALKRFVTDRVDPSTFEPERIAVADENSPRVAVIGAGPAGLSAAHYLSLRGCKVTIFEGEEKPGGMMLCAIPSYRLPREVIEKEIAAILDENVTLKCNTALGRDISIDGLFKDGFKAVFLALGAHKSRRLGIEGENAKGVFPSIQYLKSFNLRGENPAKGKIGIVGGGNSAVDAARVAVRQKDVESVTIYYRRSRDEMPAFEEEIEAMLEEGVELEALVSPVSVKSEGGRVSGLELIRNQLGDVDAGGRRKPVPLPGTEYTVALDALIVAISESPDIDCLSSEGSTGIDVTKWQTVKADANTMLTNQAGVFAGGDVVRGANTVVEAIADGKKAALMIDRYLRGEELRQPVEAQLPEVYVESLASAEDIIEEVKRIETRKSTVEQRAGNFAEVEMSIGVEEAKREACRCLRCDLEFTDPGSDKEE